MKRHVGCSIPIDVSAVGTRNVFWRSSNRDGSWRTLSIRLRQKEWPNRLTAVSAIHKHFRIDFHLLLALGMLYKFAITSEPEIVVPETAFQAAVLWGNGRAGRT